MVVQMKSKFVCVRMMQTVYGSVLQVPMAIVPDEAAAKRFCDDRNRELEAMFAAVIAGPGPDGKARSICKVGEFMQQSFGMAMCGHSYFVLKESDGGPDILVPKSGIIIQ